MRTVAGLRGAALVALLIAAWSCAGSPAPEALPANPTVDDIVARHLAARGGADRLRALRSMRATGLVMASGGRVAPVVREIERPGRIRLEMTYQGLASVYAHDGVQGWRVAPNEGLFEPQALPADVAAPSVDQLDIEGPLVDWKKKGHKVSLVGRTEIAGRPAWDLELRLSSGVVRHDYIDAETWMLLRADVERVVRGHKTRLETTFGDYRDVGGLQWPHQVEMRVAGRPESIKFVVQKVELDPEIDDARFRLPP